MNQTIEDEALALRILRHIDDSAGPQGCWHWDSDHSRNGYSRTEIKRDGKRGHRVMIHRWMYERENGPIPAGLQLDHLCRNRGCVNPAHLEAVSPQENARRAAASRRDGAPRFVAVKVEKLPINFAQPLNRGERNGNAKLTEAQVIAIRASALSTRRLAVIYSVSNGLIHGVKTGERWSHIPLPFATPPATRREFLSSQQPIEKGAHIEEG